MSSTNVKEILKIKESFPELSSKKIEEIHKSIDEPRKEKPRINMTTKGPSRRQVIIPMSNENSSKFMLSSEDNIANINRALKNIKSDTLADFVRIDHCGLIITTNKVASMSDLNTIERYIKNVNNIELNDISSLRLPQLKSYLKIIGIPYLIENTNTLINSSMVETIIKNLHIFNDVVLASKPRVIKVLPKSDIVIIWVDIWNVQSGSKVKYLINRCFNIGNFITIIQGVIWCTLM